MNLAIKLLPRRLPGWARHVLLVELGKATAQAFECLPPAFNRGAHVDQLEAYARFTRTQAESALRDGQDAARIKTRLYQAAVPLGERLRRWLQPRGMADLMAITQALYRAIEIDFHGNAQGELTVTRCYFSRYYSCEVCDLISAMDAGIFSGLSAGGRLRFTERMTQGKAGCKAVVQIGGEMKW